MKKGFLLCVILSVAMSLIGCANQPNTTADNRSQRGLVGPGSVGPVSGGPSGPGHIPQRYEPWAGPAFPPSSQRREAADGARSSPRNV